MTGTPLDLTPFGSILQGIGLLYWLIVIAALAIVLIKFKSWSTRTISAAVVLAIMVGPVALHGWKRYQQQQQFKARLDAAMARFEMRCKSAREKIYKTVDGVDGILLLNVRPEAKPSDRSDPNWPDAALPDESQGDWYLRTFLFWEQHDDKRAPRGYLNEKRSELPGYEFVDVKDADGQIYRFRLVGPNNIDLSREIVTEKPARYAVSYVNFIDPEDRRYWIAGTKVLITDTFVNEIIAEKTWFSIEPGQGNAAGFRSPWGFAHTCPTLNGRKERYPTRFFVDQVLNPKKGK